MFGKLISSVIKVATLPVDAASASLDIITGGTGSKRSRKGSETFPNPFALIEEVRDRVCESAEAIDNED
jgi:hypothetical protein